jgi:hypothetical protein
MPISSLEFFCEIRVSPSLPHIDSALSLKALAQTATRRTCECALRQCAPWDSVSEGDWPASQMTAVATLRDPLLDEPTFLEFHPDGSRYDSPDAPIAPLFFPFNRCDIWHCGRCDQHWLRYTEFGGYYIDPRSRRLDPTRVIDAPLPRTAAE